MPLSLTEFNHFHIINKVCGLEKQRHYLESLGFVPGTQVTILSELHGYYVVMVKGSKIGLDKDHEVIGYQFVHLGKMMEAIKKGVDPKEAYEKNVGSYGRFAEAVEYIDPRHQ